MHRPVLLPGRFSQACAFAVLCLVVPCARLSSVKPLSDQGKASLSQSTRARRSQPRQPSSLDLAPLRHSFCRGSNTPSQTFDPVTKIVVHSISLSTTTTTTMASELPALALPPTLSPDDLDALSELSIVLAKVRAGLQSSSGITTGATPGGPSSSGQQLSFKDVPGATDKLKHKLQHARAQVRALPDMDRSVEEQMTEIKELETRIQLQRALLEKLRENGVQFSKDAYAGGDKMEL